MLSILSAALLLGFAAGLRAMTPLAALSWAAHLGGLGLAGTWLGFLASPWAAWILTVLAVGELVTDKLPSTPSRKVPVQFGTRVLVGGVGGFALGMTGGFAVAAVAAGIVGAIAGTFAGAMARGRLATIFGRDLPAALVEDVAAIAIAACIAAGVIA